MEWRLVFDVEEIKLLLIVSCEQWSFLNVSLLSKTYLAVIFSNSSGNGENMKLLLMVSYSQ